MEVDSSSETPDEVKANFETDAEEQRKAWGTDQREAKPVKAQPIPEESEPEPEKKKNPRFDAQARIREATGQLSEERSRRKELEAELAEARQGAKAPAETPAETTPEPQLGDFDVYEDFVKATARWEGEQAATRKFEALQEEQNASTAQEAHVGRVVNTVETYNERVEAAKASDPDVMSRVSEDIQALYPTFMLTPDQRPGPENDIAEAIVKSPNTVALQLFLTEHPEEMDKLMAMPDAYAIHYAMGGLEARAVTPAKEAPEAPEPKEEPMSNAKPPIRPVSGSPQRGEEEVDDDTSFDEHKRIYDARDRRNAAR